MERTRTAPLAAASGARSRREPQMRPGMMTDAEINAELKTAVSTVRACGFPTLPDPPPVRGPASDQAGASERSAEPQAISEAEGALAPRA
jgi:hypothetical protein